MSDDNKGSFLDELFDLGNEALALANTIPITRTDERPAQTFEPESIDHMIGVALRRLVETVADKGDGDIRIGRETSCFRLYIGEGVKMRAHEGRSIGDLIHNACEGERVVIDATSRGDSAKR